MHNHVVSPTPIKQFFLLPIVKSAARFHSFLPNFRIGYNYEPSFKIIVGRRLIDSPCHYYTRVKNDRRRKYHRNVVIKSIRRESPYEVLGLSPSATPDEIKRAYRRLALKYHPDVNKEANSQEKFMRIKHAYNTLLNSKSRKRYDDSEFSYSRDEERKGTAADQEEFYGFEDFFRDIQEEFRNWEANAASQGKPKSLWEELAEIGEEFVEFLEKELNITDMDSNENGKERTQRDGASYRSKEKESTDDATRNGIKENIDDIEAALAQLKKELGL